MNAASRTRSIPVLTAVGLVRAYQATVRPLLMGSCKFCPSCSEYAIEALTLHGLRGGGWLALRRLLRCHPFGMGGIDPVPSAVSSSTLEKRMTLASEATAP